MKTTLDYALEYVDTGYEVFPAAVGGKAPALAGVDWRTLLTTDRQQVCAWWKRRPFNIAVGTRCFDVLDWDARLDLARSLLAAGRAVTTAVQTPNAGMHQYFRPSGAPGHKFEHGDAKAWPSYVIGAGSRLPTGEYRFLTPLVPVDRLHAAPEEYRLPARPAVTRGTIAHALAYAMKVESFEGQHGSHGLVRFFAILRDAGYTEAQAMAAAIRWNSQRDRVVPAWSLDALARACSRTFAKGA